MVSNCINSSRCTSSHARLCVFVTAEVWISFVAEPSSESGMLDVFRGAGLLLVIWACTIAEQRSDTCGVGYEQVEDLLQV